MNRSADGAAAKQQAATFLQKQGLKLLEATYRCRFSELDLIMRDGNTLLYFEVRLRKSQDFGGVAASITAHKQARLIRTARHYLSTLKTPPPCRFDAVLLSGAGGRKIEWIKNAFEE